MLQYSVIVVIVMIASIPSRWERPIQGAGVEAIVMITCTNYELQCSIHTFHSIRSREEQLAGIFQGNICFRILT